MKKIGFDIYELNDDEAFYIEYALREQIDIVGEIVRQNGFESDMFVDILNHIKNAHRKVCEINEKNGIAGYKRFEK